MTPRTLRQKILDHLEKTGPTTTAGLAEHLEAPRTTVYTTLYRLRTEGLVLPPTRPAGGRPSRALTYSINPDPPVID